LVALDAAILAYPVFLFDHKQSFGEFTVYSNRPLPADFGEVIEGARARVTAMEHARPGARCRVFICESQRLYSFFALLTRRTSNTMGIGLSVFGNMYLNEPKIDRIAASVRGIIRHSRFEGNFAEVIAHEIAHFNVVKTLGFRRAVKLPVWKSEGYAEYQANVAATRADSSYAFTDRIDLLLNDAFWGSGNSPARQLFEWHLLVEFLAEVNGYKLEDLIDEAVTESLARDEMLAWYNP
jgi:hypothetical protein